MFRLYSESEHESASVAVDYALDGEDSQRRIFTNQQVLGMVLAKVVGLARQRIAKSPNPMAKANFAISVPAHFGSAQLTAVAEAATLAGLDNNSFRLVSAAEAAAACYAARHAGDITSERKVAFLNIGHTHAQAAVYCFTPAPKEDQAGDRAVWNARGAPVCLKDVSGDGFDQLLFEEFAQRIQEEHGVIVTPGTKMGLRLLTACRKARVILSANKSATIHLECFGPNEVDMLYKLDRSLLERVCAPARDALRKGLTDLLAAAGVTAADLFSLELLGGVTCTPFVLTVAEAAVCNSDKIGLTMDRASAVAVGAAHALKPEASTVFLEVPDSLLPAETLADWRAVEEKMAAQDAVLSDISDARNELEAYVFETRQAGETHQPQLFDREGTLPLLTEAEEWLFSDAAEAALDATVVSDYHSVLSEKVNALNKEWAAAVAEEQARAREAEKVQAARLEAERLADATANGEDHDFRRMKKTDRMKYALKNKAEATELFKGGNYAHATQRYIKALAHCGKFVDLVTDEDKKEVETLTLSLHLNLALLYIKQDSHKKALASADDALKIDSGNPKGLYRKALALEALKDFREALATLKAAVAAAPEDSALAKAQTRIQAKLTAETQKEKRMYSKMFG